MTIVASQNEEGATVIAISGRFDFGCHPEFRATMEKLAPGSEVVVNLSETTHIDSAALGMLLLLRDRLGSARHLRLSNCSGQPAKVLRMANFDKLFHCDAD